MATKLGFGLPIVSVADTTTTTPDITFARRHGLHGLVDGTLVPGSANDHTTGTYHNVKIYDDIALTFWRGATARVVVSAGGTVTDFDIVSQGSSCLLYTSPSPRDRTRSRMPSSA